MQELKAEVSLFGKHPSSSEYLHLGISSSFTDAISHWIESSYEVLLQSRIIYSKDSLKHFYFLNEKEDSFICGTLGLSRDSKNREYPLVVFAEVYPYSYFSASHVALQFSHVVCRKMLDIFTQKSNKQELRVLLQQISILETNSIKAAIPSYTIPKIEDDIEDKSVSISVETNLLEWQHIPKDLSGMAKSIFMDREFKKSKLFFRALKTDDFITMMR
ncbi:MAG: type VI secretion system-associated protein TagF [Campylobacterota bacterium]|nr:type VI secretion system-associated protein TagF [Campylobacterota bacterium]